MLKFAIALTITSFTLVVSTSVFAQNVPDNSDTTVDRGSGRREILKDYTPPSNIGHPDDTQGSGTR